MSFKELALRHFDPNPTARDVDLIRFIGPSGRKLAVGRHRMALVAEKKGLMRGSDDGTWFLTEAGLALLTGPVPERQRRTRKPSEFGHMFIGTVKFTADGKTVTTTEVEKHLENGLWVDGPPPARKSTQRKGTRR